ncbi:MAG: transcription-repair coupling factor [Litorilinea sp.]
MDLSQHLKLAARQPAFRAWFDDNSPQPQGVIPAARPFLAAALQQAQAGPLLYLTARAEIAQALALQLETWLPGGSDRPRIFLFAEPDALPFERIHWSNETRQQRLTALAMLQSSADEPPPIILASVRALMQKTLPPRELRMALRPVRVGDELRLEQVVERWVQTGYNPADVVEEPGAFARRGGIVDIWPPNLPLPVRIDLFGDDVESLRVFDPATQRTLQKVEKVAIGPGSEAIAKYGPAALQRLGLRGDRLNQVINLRPDDLVAAAGPIDGLATAGDISDAPEATMAAASPLQDPQLLLAVREELRHEVELLAEGHAFHGVEWYLPYFYEQPGCLLDYVTPETTVVLDDGLDFNATLVELEGQAGGLHTELVRSGEAPRNFRPSFFSVEEIRRRLLTIQPRVLGHGDLLGKESESNTNLARAFAPGPRYGGKIRQIVTDTEKFISQGHAVGYVTRQAARVQSALQDAGIPVAVVAELRQPLAPRQVTLVQGLVGEGFILRGVDGEDGRPFDAYLLTDTELFGWSKPQARRRTKSHSTVAPEIFFADVKPGEHVVHLEHGVGVYDGLVKMEVGGVQREYLQVSYARGDKLYVPVHQAERLSRFVGAGEKTPPVNRLGTADWQTVKDRARRAVADIADDLLQLYAERELVRGHAYSPDGPWQDELAAAFPFEETDDQLLAIDAVRADMESDRPMDRLICGDVGYGKTEVAVRAAFKAVTDGKQVAMLVPTTVLAQQHFRTMSARLRPFPVRVEVLSRFRTPAQQEAVVRGLADGSVDVLVGTHRLLSQDVEFKDLGLLIIDEEQRFGVQQKERLKELRTQIDVLTLSATPIPRTLHMSLSGVRDMSTINTPPKERLPIHTVLAEFDDVMVRQAIERELARNGQIFVVTDRVRGIQVLADRVQHLVPQASVAIGHGQMAERQLEEVMMRFADGDFDVLVATTIIENGLDIPNANTIVIHHADRFGLAQLYQLRGRVGRSTQRGHCYLLYDKANPLSYDSRRRLAAIMESSEELGAGFRIAMRDLEIRGAGDLLGARQHGHIDSVGFDLYTRLLAQAINEAKRKKSVFERAEDMRAESPDAGAVDAAAVAAEMAADLAADVATNGKSGQAAEAARDVGTAPAHYEDIDGPFDIQDPLAPPVQMDLPIDAQIPGLYIDDESLRLQMYRRIAGLTHVESIEEIRRELLDRFGKDMETGDVPEEVENLLYQIRVKILALRAGVQIIGRELEQLVIRSEALENINRDALQRRLDQAFGQHAELDLAPDDRPRVARRSVYLPLDEAGLWRSALLRTLEIMAFS